MTSHSAPKRIGLTALLVLSAVIASCTPRPEPIPPPEDSIPVQATADPQQPAHSVTIPANDEVVFDLLAIGDPGLDVFYVELSADLPLELRRSSNYGTLVASSSSPAFFASGASGLGAAAAEEADLRTGGDVEPQAIGVRRVCAGSCAIREIGEKLHARVRNTTQSPQTVTLFYFGDVFQDDGEPDNDDRATATALASDDEGAIELIGDRDFWRAPTRRNVTLTQAAGALPVRGVVVNADGVAVSEPFAAGTTVEVCEGFYVRVTAATANRAAAPGRSAYVLSSDILPPDPGCGQPQTVAISAGTDPGSPRHTATLPPGGALFLDMGVPPSVRNMPVLYFELDADVSLELRNAANTSTLASSSSSNFFAAGTGGLAAGALEGAPLTGQSIATTVQCRGSCVLVRPSLAVPAYVGLVRNEGPTSVTVNVFLYGDALVDEGETANDSRATAPQLASSDAGAIETIGDVDHFRVNAFTSIDFDPGPGIALAADVVTAAGTVVDGPIGGGTLVAKADEFVRVRAANSNQAAASARSSYFLSFGGALTEAEIDARRASGEPR